jgi:hypothetical protein
LSVEPAGHGWVNVIYYQYEADRARHALCGTDEQIAKP